MFSNGFSFKTNAELVAFFKSGAPGLSPEDMEEILEALPDLVEERKNDAEQMRRAVEDIMTIATKSGAKTLQQLLTMTSTEAPELFAGALVGPTSSTQSKAPPVRKTEGSRQFRKPHLNPLDPNTDAYSLDKVRVKPGWLIQLEKDGWTIEDLHFKNIGRAAKARGFQLPWDPIQKHEEIKARS